MLKILLEKRDFDCFYKELMKDIQKLQKNIITVKIKDILDRMGFPENYKKLLKL